MPYTLKTNQISVKDPETGEYSGVDILAEQTEQGLIAELQAEGTTQVNRINQAAVDVQAAVDQAESDAATIISSTQSSINTLEAQKNTIAQTVASMAELGTDTTLSTPGMAADAGAVGDLSRQISDKAPVILKAASGAIASFDDGADSMPVRKLVAKIEPMQAAGTPSPENPLPISGWTGCTISHSGADTTDPDILTISWEAKAGTVYGGTLTLNPDRTGSLTVDRAVDDLGSFRWYKQTTYNYFQCLNQPENMSFASYNYNTPGDIKSSNYETKAWGQITGNNTGIFLQNGYFAIKDMLLVDYSADEFKSAMAGVQFLYYLANPITIPLTATEISAILTTLYGTNNIWSSTGDIEVIYPADTKTIVDSKADDAVYELIDENRKSIKEIADNKPDKNLINPQLLETGAIAGQSGDISTQAAYAGYVTSAFIPISENTDYMFSTFLKADGRVSTTRKIYLLYDENKTPISGTYFNEASLYEVPIANTTAKYIRVSSGESNNLMLEEGTTRTAYEEYSEGLKLNDEIPLTSEMIKNVQDMGVTDSLSGKKWAVLGDSFTDYTNKLFDSGKYAGQYASYPRLIALRTGINALLQFCLSGRTLAYPSDGTFTNSVCCPTATCYYQNIPEDVDYVTIMLGINDSQHDGRGSTGDGEDATGIITLGTITDADTSTYYGAWNVVLGWLRENRPFAHVGIVISNGIEDPDWVGAIEAVARKWGYPTLNLNGDDRCPVMIRAYNPDVPSQIKQIIKEKQAVDYDGTITGSANTHPNWQTHELESTIFEAWLRSL